MLQYFSLHMYGYIFLRNTHHINTQIEFTELYKAIEQIEVKRLKHFQNKYSWIAFDEHISAIKFDSCELRQVIY